MPRWTTVLLSVLLVGSVALVVWKARPRGSAASVAESSSVAARASAPETLSDAGPPVKAADAGSTQPIVPASAIPPLPDSAPKSVAFGVILFTFSGAQGAPKDARTKDQALASAKRLLAEARTDFAEAAKKGDPGSTADAGRIPRGVLEPALEYALFTLEPGAVHSEPLATPRGYWIVRRIR